MPLHNWTRVPAGLFHHFHQDWSIEIARELNRGRLPRGVAALVEQRAGPREGDVLAIETRSRAASVDFGDGGVATLDPPTTRIVRRSTREIYAGRANRIVIRHHLGRIVAVIEIVSPGNKDTRAAFRDFIEKTIEFIRNGIHVLVIDLFPPTPRDPFGMHKAIWDEIGDEEDFQFPPGKDRILASYKASEEQMAYLEPIGIGDEFRDMPIFLSESLHVKVPLATTYAATWEASPRELRDAVETGIMPQEDAE
jgi:hypothetical protein